MDQTGAVRRKSIRDRLSVLVVLSSVPFIVMTVYLPQSLKNYGRSCDSIISNMTIANSYNVNQLGICGAESSRSPVGCVCERPSRQTRQASFCPDKVVII